MIIEVTMNWAKWVLVVIYILALLGTIASVGKPRKPLDSGAAAFSVVFTGVLISLVLIA
jgi:hypothetical protein